jgi:hypothetical protein
VRRLLVEQAEQHLTHRLSLPPPAYIAGIHIP